MERETCMTSRRAALATSAKAELNSTDHETVPHSLGGVGRFKAATRRQPGVRLQTRVVCSSRLAYSASPISRPIATMKLVRYAYEYYRYACLEPNSS